MTDMLIDSVLAAFILGGIVGAVIALGLKSSRLWGGQPDAGTAQLQPVRVRGTRRYRR